MKKTILSIALLCGSFLIPACSEFYTQPEEPQQMYIQSSSDVISSDPEKIGERPNRDTVKKDTTERKKDTTNTGRKDTVKKAPPTIFNDLLIRLELSAEQRVIVEKLLAEHRSCIENCTKPLKEAEAKILAEAKSKETEIKRAVELGKILKSEARKRLAALKASVNKALKDIPIRSKVQECMKSCDAAFINQLEKILSDKQKLVLKTWLDSRSKRGTSGKKDTVNVKPRG